MGWKELLGHTRAWAVVIGLLFQVLINVGVLALGNTHVEYIQAHAPIILATLWGALVLGKSYEDKLSGGATSALGVWRDPNTKDGGWRYALTRLFSDEAFVATLLGTVLSMVALAAPLWPGLEKLQGIFTSLAYAVAVLCGLLTGALKYSAAHSEGKLSNMPKPDKPPE